MGYFHRAVAGAFVACALSVTSGASATTTVSFGEPGAISPTDGRAMAPDIAVGADGAVHVLWVDKAPPPEVVSAADAAAGHTHIATDQLWYRRSSGSVTDGKIAALGAPVRVNSRDGEVWGFAVSKPELDLDGRGNVHVFFTANDVQARSGKGVLVARYTRSTDGGLSFAPRPTRLAPCWSVAMTCRRSGSTRGP